MFRYRFSITLAAMATVMMLFAGDAQARAGGGFSSGSRGMRTFVMPPTTRTAPNSAAPIERSIAQPGAAPANQAAVRPGLFGGGLFGSMAGFASLLGLLLQLVLVVFVGKLIFAWWRRRNMQQPAYVAAHPGPDFGGFGGAAGSGPPPDEPLVIGAEDYDTFEQMLYDIQADFSAEDMEALRNEVTPELLSYFAEQLADNAKRGLVNRVTDVKLLQGDLAEAWREDDADYATVTIRFANTDSVVERASGRVVEGGTPDETTELWTFTRARRGDWMLSAIQQT